MGEIKAYSTLFFLSFFLIASFEVCRETGKDKQVCSSVSRALPVRAGKQLMLKNRGQVV